MAAATSKRRGNATIQVTVASRTPAEETTDWLVVMMTSLGGEDDARLPTRVRAIDRTLGGRIAAVVEMGDFRGARDQRLALYPEGKAAAARVLLVGLGDEDGLDADRVRRAAGAALQAAEQRGGGKLAIVLPASRRLRSAASAGAVAEGLILASYRFDQYTTQPPRNGAAASGRVGQAVLLVERAAETRAARAAAGRGVNLATSQNLARQLSNEPPNLLPPAALAREATRVAREVGLRVRVLEPAELRRRKLGAMLAVAQGSTNTPRMIVLEHNAPARGQKRRRKTIALVGKGVCFDSGGLSLKPAASMVKMKHDMSGAAAVIGAMRAVALLKVPHHVVGVVGAVENMPSGTAYRPDDILTSGSGKTIEVTNTDAEGRLVLADALHFVRGEYEPEAIIDLATLTGACAIALGPWAAAVVGNHEKLSELIVASGEAVGERFWPLPLWDVHRDHMRSRIADVRQTGGRDAGTTTAAAFLSHFAGDQPWAHLDIASVADTETAGPLHRGGATGFGVRALLEVLDRYGDAKL